MFLLGRAPGTGQERRRRLRAALGRPGEYRAGVPVQEGEHIVPDLLTSCGWAGPGGPSIGSKKIVLSLMTARSFVAGKTPVKGVTMSVAEGVGDDAYFISMPPF